MDQPFPGLDEVRIRARGTGRKAEEGGLRSGEVGEGEPRSPGGLLPTLEFRKLPMVSKKSTLPSDGRGSGPQMS